MFIVRQVEDASSVPTGIAHFASGTLSPNTVHEAYESYVIRSCVVRCTCNHNHIHVYYFRTLRSTTAARTDKTGSTCKIIKQARSVVTEALIIGKVSKNLVTIAIDNIVSILV